MTKCYFLFIYFFFLIHVTAGQSWSELNKEAIILYNKKDFVPAIPIAKKAIEAAKKEFGEVHSSYVSSLNLAAYLYINTNDRPKAEPLFKQVVESIKKLNGEENAEYAKALHNLGALYKDMQLFANAEQFLLKAKEIRVKVLGENHIEYFGSLLYLGSMYMELEKFTLAETTISEATVRSFSSLGEYHNITLSAMTSLAILYDRTGQHEKAEPLFTRIIKNYQDNKKENLPFYPKLLFRLGDLYIDLGQPQKAEATFLAGLENTRKYSGEKSIDFLSSLNILSYFYIRNGNYKKAEEVLNQALVILQTLPPPHEVEHSKTLNNIASLYTKSGQFNKALEFLVKAETLIKKNNGENHASYAANLTNQAIVLQKMKQYAKAESLYLKANEYIRSNGGENTVRYFTGLIHLGDLYIESGEVEKAESFLKRGIELQQKNLGEHHPDHLLSLRMLAKLYEETGRYKMSEPLIISANKLTMLNLINSFTALSEQEKRNYLNNNTSMLESSNSFLYNHRNASGELVELNFGLLVMLKSLSLADTRNMLEAVRKSKNSEVARMLKEWDSLKIILAKEYSLPVATRRKELKEIEKKSEELEKTLNLSSTSFRKQREALNTSLWDMQMSLKPAEAIVEFVRFRLYNTKWTDSIMYAAYVVTKNDSVPRFIPLCEEKQLQHIFDSAGRTATSMVSKFYRGLEIKNKNVGSLGKQLYQLIWAPLEPWLKGIKSIAYSPAGKLYNIAFHALPVDSSKLLLDKYTLQQYTTTRQVGDRGTESKIVKPQSIVLFGNPNFTLDSVSRVKQIITQPGNEKKSVSIYDLPSRGNNSSSWGALPGTAEEVKKIKELFDKNKISTQLFTNQKASEENLKAIHNNSPQILHIATHGFFLQQASKVENETDLTETNNYTFADDPLLRSGLILAGGNYVWSGKNPIDGVEDGIATAYEISQLNLSNTELVVLSACETALGDVKGSEGVFGLQRAFKMAGVKKMIVSLWQVPDKETAELMTAFYSYWMKGKTINDAFSQAQADMRKKYSPFYWAAFVLVE